MRGGKRERAGRKSGSFATDPRNVIKQIRWTQREWEMVEAAASLLNKTASDFQRDIILPVCKEIISG